MAKGKTDSSGGPRDPWLILPEEPARAYAAFEAYRDMGPDRSHRKAVKISGRDLGSIQLWSSRYGWVERVRAFDAQAADLAAVLALEDAATVRARQARDARKLQERAMAKIDVTSADELTVREATDLWRTGADAERKALGIADKLEHSGPAGGPIPIDVDAWRRELGLDGGDGGPDRPGA